MSAATMDEGRLTTVIVPRKWVDAAATPDGAYHMSAAIVDYVNDVQQAGVFARHEMPAKAMQAYHADYYLAQVNNGGHSQFIGNSGELLRTITADALAGLEAMGAEAQHQILTEMAAWAAANPADAGAQDGFGIRARAARRAWTPGSTTAEQTRQWPNSPRAGSPAWPELRIVEDDQYAAAIEELAALQPRLANCASSGGISQNIRYQVTDPLQIAIAAACGAVEPEPEIKVGVGGGLYQEIEGEECLAFKPGNPIRASGCACPVKTARAPLRDHPPKPPPRFRRRPKPRRHGEFQASRRGRAPFGGKRGNDPAVRRCGERDPGARSHRPDAAEGQGWVPKR